MQAGHSTSVGECVGDASREKTAGLAHLPGSREHYCFSGSGGHHLPPGARACSLESDPSTPVPACDWGHVSHTRRPPVVMVFSLPWRAVLSDSWAPCQAILLRVEQRRWLEHAGEGGAQDPVWAGGRPPPGFRCGCVAGGGVSPISLGSSGHRSAEETPVYCSLQSQWGGRLLGVFGPGSVSFGSNSQHRSALA